jgi:hypothetical protein
VPTANQNRLVAEIVRGFRLLGYDDDLIGKKYTFRDCYDANNTERTATLAAFGEIPFSPESACFAVLTSDGEQGKSLVLKYRALAAPFALEVSDAWVDFWTVGRTAETTRRRFRINESELAKCFREHAADWSSSSVLRAKNIATTAKPRQRDLYDFGLVPEVDELVFQKLDPLLRDAFTVAVSTYQTTTGAKPDARNLFRLVFWLLAGKVFHDNGIAPFDSLSAQSGPDNVLGSVAEYYGVQVPRLLDRATREAAFTKTWTQLDFRHVSIEVLTRIWATTFVTPEVREKLGIHRTPPSLVRYIVDRLPFGAFENPGDLKKEDRFIIEPCSGSSAFLIASLHRLKKLWRSHDLTPSDRHTFFQKVLVGFENEVFGVEIGRLCLTLADQNRDHWQLNEDDVLASEAFTSSLKQARIVLCNPPFEDIPKERRQASAFTFVQQPAEILHRVLEHLHPNGIIGFVLPQVILDGQSYPAIRRKLGERYKTIEVVSVPDAAFRPAASKETVLLLAYDPKKSPGESLIRHAKILGRDWTKFQLLHKPTREDVASKSVDEIAASLAVPELGRLWNRLAPLETLGKLAKIHRGIEWNLPLLTSKRKETGNRAKLVSSTKKPGFEFGVPPRAKSFYSFQIPETAYLDMRPQSLDTKKALEWPWKSPKIIINAKTKSRGTWRMAAFADHQGMTCYQTFTAIWPNDPSNLIVLTAVLNGPVANAFVATREGKTDITNETLEMIPVPAFSATAKKEVENLVEQYIKTVATSKIAPNRTDENAESLLKRIDALVLSAYDLPPRLERDLLEKTRGDRRHVSFRFQDYFPANYGSSIPLSLYLSEKYQKSTPQDMIDNLPIVTDPELLEALRDAE